MRDYIGAVRSVWRSWETGEKLDFHSEAYTLTLTTPNCPVADSLPQEVKVKVQSLDEVKEAEVELTFDPPWTRDLMSEEAKLELGFL